MNKTEWGNGFHLTPEAMEFLQNEFSNGFKQLLSPDIASSFIISGCSVVDGVRQDGVVVVAGEIMPFKANGTSTDYIKVSETATKNVYKNNESYDAYYTRYAECNASEDSSVKAKFSEMKTFRMSARFDDVDWTDVSLSENYGTINEQWEKYGFPKAIYTPMYCISNNQLMLRGGITTTVDHGFAADNVIGTIDVKPLKAVKIPAIGYISSEGSYTDIKMNCVITLNTDGTLTFKTEDFGHLAGGASCLLFESVLFNYIPTRID